MALNKEGKLFVFGSNSYGQLGIQDRSNKINAPKQVTIAKQTGKVVDFTCGEEHSAFVDEHGHVYTWGFGVDGQLGHGNKNSINQPTKLQFEPLAKSVKCGAGHTGILTTTGDLYLMGRGRDG